MQNEEPKSEQPAPPSDNLRDVDSTRLLGIGSTIWLFDNNRRIYPEPRGEHNGGPIYREHWRPVTIEGETARSWVTSWYGKKVPKRGPRQGVAFTDAEVDADVWAHDHRYKIVRMVELCEVETLKAIAQAVGYMPNPMELGTGHLVHGTQPPVVLHSEIQKGNT